MLRLNITECGYHCIEMIFRDHYRIQLTSQSSKLLLKVV